MLQLGDSFYAGVFRSGSSVAHRLLTSHSKQGISNPGMEAKAEETVKPSEAGLRETAPQPSRVGRIRCTTRVTLFFPGAQRQFSDFFHGKKRDQVRKEQLGNQPRFQKIGFLLARKSKGHVLPALANVIEAA